MFSFFNQILIQIKIVVWDFWDDLVNVILQKNIVLRRTISDSRVPDPPPPLACNSSRWTLDIGQRIGHWTLDKGLDIEKLDIGYCY